jgi:ubiquinol-cytochrome c reductase cytochrome c subunit
MRTRRLLLPAALLGSAAVASLAVLVPAAVAGASGHADASPSTQLVVTHVVTRSCGPVNVKGVTASTPNAGNPFLSSSRVCLNGHLIQYGNRYLTYANPPRALTSAGQLLFAQTCASCHGNEANGVDPQGQATIGPNLQGVGAATVDFWVTTGRMPAADVKAVEAERRATRLTPLQALELAAWVDSLAPSTPAVPTAHLQGADQSVGQALFSLNCAACHTIEGTGDALAQGTNAPSIDVRNVTAQQVAEAIRTGPANMPRFTGNLSDQQVADIVSYVTGRLQHPTNPGGFSLGGVGPVAEGFVALLIGVGGLALVCFWIGERTSPGEGDDTDGADGTDDDGVGPGESGEKVSEGAGVHS